MNKVKIVAALSLIYFLSACVKEKSIQLTQPPLNAHPDTIYGVDPAKIIYDITETFERGIKASYHSENDTTTLSTGIWNLKDAIIATSGADGKIGNWSVRVENNGSVTTNFKISGLKKIYISSSLYGNDAASSYTLETSTDSSTYKAVSGAVNVSSKTIQSDSFSITTSAPIFIRIAKGPGGKRINIDNVEFKGIGNPGFKLDTSDSVTPPPNYDGDTTPRYVVIMANDVVPPTTGDNSNLLLGNPSNADSSAANTENHLFNQHYYIESYSMSQGKPNWTAWHLVNEDIGSSGRGDDFAAWAGLPNSWYKVGASDYNNSGYERGHNCPSADRTSSVNANDATFLMTNMMPQTAANNEHTWANLENDTRYLVQNGNEAYIYCGSYGNAKTIDNGHITVPTNTWKIVVVLPNSNNDINRITTDTRVIAVNIPNTTSVVADWKQYITTVKDIETATGYNFFTSVTDTQIRNALKTKKDSGK